MLKSLFYRWERRLASVTTDRVVGEFDWGLDWLANPPCPGSGSSPGSGPSQSETIRAWSAAVLENSERFFETPPLPDNEFVFTGDALSFPSAMDTPHPENNRVHARYCPTPAAGGSRRAVVVLPQWNADPDAHMALSRLIARFGVSALRLSLPYHDSRMPAELHRADYIVSANIGRTLQVCRQAVLDARRAVHWLSARGYERIGILGTSLGSCLAMLTAAHEPKIDAAALNHISPYFADVIWEGLSTEHVRAGLDGEIELDELRRLWMPISPRPYIDRMREKRTLLVYARYDLSFPVRLSRALIDEFRQRTIRPNVFELPCGHYSTGTAPFSWIDAYVLIRFLRRAL